MSLQKDNFIVLVYELHPFHLLLKLSFPKKSMLYELLLDYKFEFFLSNLTLWMIDKATLKYC